MRVKSYAVGVVCTLAVLVMAADAAAQQLTVLRISGDTGVRCSTLNQSTDPALAGLKSNFSFKIEPPESGVYHLTQASGELMGGAPVDPANSIRITMGADDSGETFDWTSTLGIDAVIVKGGTDSLVYILDTKTGTSAHAPINLESNRYHDISHIEFCYDYEVDVAQTTKTGYTRTHDWSIAQSDDALVSMFTGDSNRATYAVSYTKTTTDSDWYAEGTITVTNNTPLAAVMTGIADSMGEATSVHLSGCSQSGVLYPGSSVTCDYRAALDNGFSRVSEAVVATSGEVGGNSDTAVVTFGEPTTVVGHDSVTVHRGDGTSESTNRSGAYEYARTVSCNADEGSSTRTASIEQTGASATATLTVRCYALSVSAAPETSFVRTYGWNIAKSASTPEATLEIGQSTTVDYSVNVSAVFTDTGHTVTGDIRVHNPAPIDANITGVSGVLAGVGAVAVNCGTSFPYTLAAGATLTCSYTASVSDSASRATNATALLQNTPSGATSFSGSGQATFGAPGTVIDACVTVTDGFNGEAPATLGEACFGGTAATFSRAFSYSRQIGPFAESGTAVVTNVASFTGPSGAGGRSTATVSVTVPAVVAGSPKVNDGCTRTIGYWKNHETQLAGRLGSGVWLGAAAGDKSELVTSVASAVTILSSSDSNGINKLRAQLLAAKLNVAAAPNVIGATIDASDAFLAAHAVDDWKRLTASERKQVDAWKTALDEYNNGLSGVSHCQ